MGIEVLRRIATIFRHGWKTFSNLANPSFLRRNTFVCDVDVDLRNRDIGLGFFRDRYIGRASRDEQDDEHENDRSRPVHQSADECIHGGSVHAAHAEVARHRLDELPIRDESLTDRNDAHLVG